MHSDHVNGLPDVWMTGWLATPYGGRKAPMALYGPAGTEAMAEHLSEAFREDKRIRMADEHLGEAGILFDAHDAPPGKVYEKNGVTVTAFEVHHGDLIKPAYGYRVDYDGKSVAISGDTTCDVRVADAAQGVDLLIHEVAWIDPSVIAEFPSYKEALAHHTLPAEAGRIFAASEPRLAVFSHIVSRGAKGQDPEAADARILEEARSAYDGPVLMGADHVLRHHRGRRQRQGRQGEPDPARPVAPCRGARAPVAASEDAPSSQAWTKIERLASPRRVASSSWRRVPRPRIRRHGPGGPRRARLWRPARAPLLRRRTSAALRAIRRPDHGAALRRGISTGPAASFRRSTGAACRAPARASAGCSGTRAPDHARTRRRVIGLSLATPAALLGLVVCL